MTLSPALQARRLRVWLTILAVAALGAEGLARTGWGVVLDRLYTDTWHQLTAPRPTPTHVALVVVDRTALAAYPDDPLVFWGPYFARAIDTLDRVGARLVGLDFLYAISPDAWLAKMTESGSRLSRVYDAPFRAAVNRGGVVLAGSLLRDPERRVDHYLLPHDDYLFAVPGFDLARHVGLADLDSDNDGVVRHFVARPTARPAPEYAGSTLPTLGMPALLAARVAGTPVDSKTLDAARRTIPYHGPPGSFPRLSLTRLTAENALNDPDVRALRGRIVLIGADFAGMGDVHFTPYASGLRLSGTGLMAGVELQANITEALLSGRRIEHPGAPARITYTTTLALLAIAVFLRLPAWRAATALAGLLLLPILFSWLAFAHDLLVSVTGPQVAILLGFGGVLARRLTRESRERARVSSLFSRYVSDSAVTELLKSERMPDMGGETYTVTVLFSDIRNFTAMSEILSPAETVEMLNTYFDRVCAIALDEGGSIDKFIGDAIMVEFGAPVRNPDHARRALRAAWRIRRAAEGFQAWMEARFGDRSLPRFAVGIGLHTGPAIVGSIGSSRRSEFTAIGDTVNIASRLEGATKELHCTIVASQATVNAAGPGIATGQARELHVKGHLQPVRALEIVDLFESSNLKETS